MLCVANLLAVVSAFFVPPSMEYFGYIDWDTLALLFGLMAVMKGFQRAGLFDILANKLLKRANTSRKLMFVLVFLPFFLSMAVTNDVSLITFVPFGIIVFKSAGLEKRIIPLIVLQTLAANLGSMLTPMGNPQNLYLYNASGMSFGDLVLLMLPYVALSGAGLAAVVLVFKPVPVTFEQTDIKLNGAFSLVWPAVFFIVCLLGLFNVVPSLIIAAVILLFLLLADRKTLAKVDYSLLGTFIALFIFIGNMKNIEAFRTFLSSVIGGNEELVAVLASQVISNVPAALLLSGFTENGRELLLGVNIGGLGTPIASLASLISLKLYSHSEHADSGKYLGLFSLVNFALLFILLLGYSLL